MSDDAIAALLLQLAGKDERIAELEREVGAWKSASGHVDNFRAECQSLRAQLASKGAETQQSISQWANATFGEPRTNLSIAARARKEMDELVNVLADSDRDPAAVVEAADVIIVLMRLFERMGTTWQAEVDKKMAINRARRWVLDGNGHGSHVKGGE